MNTGPWIRKTYKIQYAKGRVIALTNSPKYTEAQRRILQQHVTNLDGNVYAVFNLPPEVTAVVFAYVSRSPASFRENLLKLVLSGDLDMQDAVAMYSATAVDLDAARAKARDFHERVTIGYGHGSVAELSNLAIGCERISRLASAELELANRWLSFIEYSQRYQRPQRGGYVVPPELQHSGNETLLERYRETQEFTFTVYEQLMDGLVPYLRDVESRGENESEQQFERRIQRLAFEDARYALTLAVHTNLGMTGNARALRDAIVRLLSDPYEETTALAEAIREEALKICPTLLRYADPNPYQQSVWQRFGWTHSFSKIETKPTNKRFVRLVDWTGRPATAPNYEAEIDYNTDRYHRHYTPGPVTEDEKNALQVILAAAFTEHGHFVTSDDLEQLPGSELLQLYEQLMAGLGQHDHPVSAAQQVSYVFELAISEANWHQLLRHCRQIHFAAERPNIEAGVTVPPRIQAADLTNVLMDAIEAANETFRLVEKHSPTAAHYLVTNAHHRRVRARVSLWEMMHLINLRGKPDAQWDIRQTVLAMRELVRQVHPHLLELERTAQLSK